MRSLSYRYGLLISAACYFALGCSALDVSDLNDIAPSTPSEGGRGGGGAGAGAGGDATISVTSTGGAPPMSTSTVGGNMASNTSWSLYRYEMPSPFMSSTGSTSAPSTESGTWSSPIPLTEAWGAGSPDAPPETGIVATTQLSWFNQLIVLDQTGKLYAGTAQLQGGWTWSPVAAGPLSITGTLTSSTSLYHTPKKWFTEYRANPPVPPANAAERLTLIVRGNNQTHAHPIGYQGKFSLGPWPTTSSDPTIKPVLLGNNSCSDCTNTINKASCVGPNRASYGERWSVMGFFPAAGIEPFVFRNWVYSDDGYLYENFAVEHQSGTDYCWTRQLPAVHPMFNALGAPLPQNVRSAYLAVENTDDYVMYFVTDDT